ncbi:marine proteobacterial sortase target protein [Rhodanobacter umsongensis]|uniref:Marine proteobacterial sortase target protein n=1 Tax=Rhodanobacter umsongensis TaxID=633153 RepID=A0ABW0JKS0_9GAMM
MRTPPRFLPALHRLLALGCLLFSIATHASAPDSGELRLHDQAGRMQSLASLDTDVEYHVSGLVAEVQVRQQFRNTGKHWLEGDYLLPLPAGAAVHSMALDIGERRIVADIKARDAARKVFEQARAGGRKAALIEADSGNLFRTAVTNVAPGEAVTIVLHYWQRVDYRSGEFSLRFPLTFTPRYHMQTGARPDDTGIATPRLFADDGAAAPLRTHIAVWLDAGVPLADVGSPSHAIVSERQGDSWSIHLRDDSVLPDRDFVLRWSPQPQTQPNVASFSQDIDGAHYAMLMLLPPQQQTQRLPRELILVIDTSGSMGGESIRQARAALDLALSRLQPGDRFNVVEFNSILDPWRAQAVAATPEAVQQARAWVSQLQAEGGTEMEPALRFALSGHAPSGYVRQVLFATDGAVDNPNGLMQLIDQRLGDSRLFPVGIGSAPNAQFLQAAARHGRGSETLITDTGTLTASMLQLLAKLDHPALHDLHVDWPAGSEAYPRELPDLYLGEPLLVTAKLPQRVAKVQVHGKLTDREWTAPMDLSTPAAAAGLDRLWAQSRIADLEDQLARGGDAKELAAEITRTALAAHLVSRYTSLVAADTTPARSAAAALKHAQVPNVMPSGTHFAGILAAGDARFAQTATPAELELWLALLALLLAALAWRMQRAAR